MYKILIGLMLTGHVKVVYGLKVQEMNSRVENTAPMCCECEYIGAAVARASVHACVYTHMHMLQPSNTKGTYSLHLC